MKVLFVYPSFDRHAASHPELLSVVPMDEYLGSPSLGIASVAAWTPEGWEVEYRDDRKLPADRPTDADLVALSFFTPAATRALELADGFRAQGKTVVAGGVFPTMMPEVVQPHVDAVVVGEGEPVWPQLLADFAAGALRPRYHAERMDLSRARLPRLDLYFGEEDARLCPDDYPFQVSRGCILSCTACALPGTMGTSFRAYEADYLRELLGVYGRAGKRVNLSEDTGWLPGTPAGRRMAEVLDLVPGSGAEVSYIGISMPMILAARQSLLQKAHAAGVRMFYLVGGFDPITKNAFTGKDPKALDRAHQAIKRAWDEGIEPYTSFLLGNDDDDEGTVDRMLEFADKADIRKAEFAIFTPYPGTPAWHELLGQGRILHRDWRRYNDANVVFRPAKLTVDQLQAGYLRLWREFWKDRAGRIRADHADRTIQF